MGCIESKGNEVLLYEDDEWRCSLFDPKLVNKTRNHGKKMLDNTERTTGRTKGKPRLQRALKIKKIMRERSMCRSALSLCEAENQRLRCQLKTFSKYQSNGSPSSIVSALETTPEMQESDNIRKLSFECNAFIDENAALKKLLAILQAVLLTLVISLLFIDLYLFIRRLTSILHY